MGSQFFWFLDLLTLAVFAVYIFRGAQKGAVGVIISAAATIVAVIAAITLSGPISEGIYDNLIKEKVGAHIDTSVSSVIENGTGRERGKIDMSKAKLDGVYLTEITPEFDSSGKAKLDLSSVDLSETGAEPDDLASFGLDKDIDLTDLRAGIVTMTKEDCDKYGLGTVVLARVISANLTSEKISGALTDIGEKLSGTYAAGLSSFGRDLALGSTDAIYTVAAALISAENADYGTQIMNAIVEPLVLPPLKIIVFLLVFAIVLAILSVIASLTKLINRIPGIGKVNGVLGAVLGAVEGLIVMIIICLVIKLVITLCGPSLVFINETTISKTFIFGALYTLNPLAVFGL